MVNENNRNDHFIRYKKTYTKLSIISGILLAFFLTLTIVFGIKLDAIRPNSQTVSVKVESVYDAKYGNEVNVIYDNKRYELINVTDSEFYKYETALEQGFSVEVLLGDDGKLYSNTSGIKNDSVTGKVYFAFLACTLVLIFSTPVLIACVVEAKKREKGK
jgi:hypothetical protein